MWVLCAFKEEPPTENTENNKNIIFIFDKKWKIMKLASELWFLTWKVNFKGKKVILTKIPCQKGLQMAKNDMLPPRHPENYEEHSSQILSFLPNNCSAGFSHKLWAWIWGELYKCNSLHCRWDLVELGGWLFPAIAVKAWISL